MRLSAAAPMLLALTCGARARAATYVVAPGGDDRAAGGESAPFRTIARAASVMAPGDVCRVHGGTYAEQVTPHASGTPDHPIVFEAYPGERPLVTGADPLTGSWATDPDGTRVLAVSMPVRQLFARGKLLPEARWPDASGDVLTEWRTAAATAGTSTTLTATSLPDGDWTGAMLHVVSGAAWTAYTRRVEKYDPVTRTITFDRPIDEMAELVPAAGDSFYLFGARRALDAPGEWFFDESRHALALIPFSGTSPEAMELRVKVRDLAFDLSGRDYVEVRGFDVFAASIRAENSHGVVIDGCNLAYPSVLRELDGYKSANPAPRITGSGNRWINGRIEHAAADGLLVEGDHEQAIDNELYDVAFSGGNFGGIETTSATDVEVRNNTVRSSGRYGIMFNGTSRSSFTYNRVDRTCLLTLDCGIFEAWNTDGQGTVIAYNELSDNHTYLGFGIYLDDSSRNFVVHHNLVHGTSFGAVHIKAANDLFDNTFAPEPRRGEPGEAIVVSESLNHRGPVDLSHSRIVNNLLRADATLRVRLGQPSITDWAYYETSVPVRAEWSTIVLDFSDFRQPGWGKPAIFERGALDQILFDVIGQGHFELAVDTLRRIPSGALLDDLDDGNATNPLGGTWSAHAGAGSTTALAIRGPGAASSAFAAVASGDSVAGGWSQLQMSFAAHGVPTDFRNDRGIAFAARAAIARTYGTPPSVAITASNADCAVDAHYLPTNACAVDRGQVVAGITDGYLGRAPDIGAFEVGAPAWKAGAHMERASATGVGTRPAPPASPPPVRPSLSCACRAGSSAPAPMAPILVHGVLPLSGLALRRRRRAGVRRRSNPATVAA